MSLGVNIGLISIPSALVDISGSFGLFITQIYVQLKSVGGPSHPAGSVTTSQSAIVIKAVPEALIVCADRTIKRTTTSAS